MKMEFRIPRIIFELRELLREYLERSQSSENGLFTPRAFFSRSWGGPQASDYQSAGLADQSIQVLNPNNIKFC